MNFLLSLLTLSTVLVLSILLLFVLGKLVWLEKATKSLLNRDPKPHGTDGASDADPYFYDLNDEALWRALTGDYQSGLSELELDEIRPRFAMALGKAVVRLVKEAPSSSDVYLSTLQKNSIERIYYSRARHRLASGAACGSACRIRIENQGFASTTRKKKQQRSYFMKFSVSFIQRQDLSETLKRLVIFVRKFSQNRLPANLRRRERATWMTPRA